MFDRDLTTAGVPADGTSCRYCPAVSRIARRDERRMAALAQLALFYLCRGKSARPTAGRRLRRSHPPGRTRFLADPYEAEQLSPVGDGLRRRNMTVRTRGSWNRKDRQVAVAEIVGDRYAADHAGQRLVCPLHARPARPDRSGARPGENQAGRGPLSGPADRRLTEINQDAGDATRRLIRGRDPDPGSLTTTPVNDVYWGCAESARIKLLTRQSAMNRARVHAPAGVPPDHRGGRTPLRAGGAPGSELGRRCTSPGCAAHRPSALHRRRADHRGRSEIRQE